MDMVQKLWELFAFFSPFYLETTSEAGRGGLEMSACPYLHSIHMNMKSLFALTVGTFSHWILKLQQQQI